jgi:hypothetical protein
MGLGAFKAGIEQVAFQKGQRQVTEDPVNVPIRQVLEGGDSICDNLDPDASLLQQGFVGSSQFAVVLDDQDLLLAHDGFSVSIFGASND